jgi:hypothetical protein
VSVFLICVLVFIVFCIVCTVFMYCIVNVYLFLFVLLSPSENSIAVSNNNNVAKGNKCCLNTAVITKAILWQPDVGYKHS